MSKYTSEQVESDFRMLENCDYLFAAPYEAIASPLRTHAEQGGRVDENSVNQALRDQEVEIATLREALREMILVHVVDDDAWDQAAETEQRMQRAIGAARSRITAHLGDEHGN